MSTQTSRHRTLAASIALMALMAFAAAPRAFAATPGPSGAGDTAATPMGDPPAEYPVEAQETGRVGYGEVQCTVGVDGKTRDCAVVGTHGSREFGDATLDFARHETFHPATHDGQPVSSTRRWKLNFTLN